MRILKLTMTNFRGIEELSLDFPETNVCVLAGENGAGKSSILDALAIVLSDVLLLAVGPLLGGHGETQETADAGRRMRLRNRESQAALFLFPQQLDVRIGQTAGSLEARLFHDATDAIWLHPFGLEPDAGFLSDIGEEGIGAIAHHLRKQIGSSTPISLPLMLHYPVGRYVSDLIGLWNQLPLDPDTVTVYEDALGTRHIDFGHFFGWFRYREDVENEKRLNTPEHRDRELQCVREAVSRMMPEFSEPRVRRLPPRLVIRKRVPASNEPLELDITQMSGGEKGLFALVGDLARRLAIANSDAEDPLAGDGVVLIDEIDLHLHPAWQRRIISRLTETFPNIQFIVTTHSPQVISEVKTESLFLLYDTPEGIKADGPLSYYGLDSNRILEELMEVSERPEPVRDRLAEYFNLIDLGKTDEAKKLRAKLEQEIARDEPEFAKADVIIRSREILGK